MPQDLAPSDNLVMGATDLATNSFGQNFNVTMVQLVSAFSATINGGYYYQPHVVKKILDSDGGTVKNVEPVLLRTSHFFEDFCTDPSVSVCTPCMVRRTPMEIMRLVRAARIAGYAMGGKTGTAEKIPRDKTNYLVSFIGFAPADQPAGGALCGCG